MTSAITAHLRALLAAATPGKWQPTGECDGSVVGGDGDRVVMSDEFGPATSDLDLIVAAHNALALLLDVAEAAEAIRGECPLTSMAEWYARADALDAALARLREAKP